MPDSHPPVLDLLRERRLELGIDSMSALASLRERLLRRGALIGVGLLGAAALISAGVFLRHRYVQGELARLAAPIEAEFKALSESNASRDAAVRKQLVTNRQLADALTTVRTSSALLTDLQLRTPDGVQLSSAEARGSSLVLKGQSADPMAFGRINALQLELKRSPLLDPRGVSLVKSERVAQQDERQKLAGLTPPVTFEINGPFAPLEALRQLEIMRKLGAEGMARRLQILQKEGLIQ
ncbi:MAG: PilN domain-containing protein [Cyanobium sp.]